MKHRIEISEADLARFCGPWSVSRKTVDVLLCEWERRNETAERFAGRAVRNYLRDVRAVVQELQEKMPECEDLPFWREALAFWQRIAALGPAEPEQPAPAGIDAAAERHALAQTLNRLLAK